jgi:hypothetical protein
MAKLVQKVGILSLILPKQNSKPVQLHQTMIINLQLCTSTCGVSVWISSIEQLLFT